MKTLPAFLLLDALILVSCKTETESLSEEKAPFDYRTYLLKDKDSSIPTFDFPLNATNEEVFKIVDNYTQQDCFDTFISITK
jgi:hypothetical protein